MLHAARALAIHLVREHPWELAILEISVGLARASYLADLDEELAA